MTQTLKRVPLYQVSPICFQALGLSKKNLLDFFDVDFSRRNVVLQRNGCNGSDTGSRGQTDVLYTITRMSFVASADTTTGNQKPLDFLRNNACIRNVVRFDPRGCSLNFLVALVFRLTASIRIVNINDETGSPDNRAVPLSPGNQVFTFEMVETAYPAGLTNSDDRRHVRNVNVFITGQVFKYFFMKSTIW